MKNLCKNNIFNSVKKYMPYIWIIVGVASLLLYLFDWLYYPGIIHPETPIDISHFMTGGMNGIADMVGKVFNMTMVEGGTYRPRIGAFIIQYCDIKLWCELNRICPLGAHFPLIIPAAFLYIYGIMLWLKGLMKDISWMAAFGLGGGVTLSTPL